MNRLGSSRRLGKIAVLVVVCGWCLSAQAKYGGGSGTEAEPYRVSAVSDWQELMATPADWASHFVLTADIDLNDVSITPIAPDTSTSSGFQGTQFTGVFDGNDYVIRNADVNMPGSDYAGLFGYLGMDGQIKNLGTEDIWILGRYYVAGLVGYNTGGTISNCYSTGSVSGDFGAGLVGMNYYGTISNCYSAGSVSAKYYVGGLVGCNYDGVINDCYSTGSVTASGDYVGGLVGRNHYGTINRSFWDVNTSGWTTSSGGTGKTTSQMQDINTFLEAGWDFVGETANGTCNFWLMPESGGYPVLSTFNGCIPAEPPGSGTEADPYIITDANDLGTVWYRPSAYYVMANDIDLAGINWSGPVVAFFCGVFDGNDHTLHNVDVNVPGSDYVGVFGYLGMDGQIKNLGTEDIWILGRYYVAGLVGYNNRGTISNCYSTGSVNGILGVGGLVGDNDGAVSNCYSTGSVSGTGSGVGGLVGSNSSGTIRNCYSTGSVSGNSAVGGLVGSNWSGSTISNCYSTGSVSGTSRYVGGLVGSNGSGGTISNCYFLDTAGRYNGYGTPLNDAQMKQQGSFAGWDFVGEIINGTDDIWMIFEGQSYPLLSWQTTRIMSHVPTGNAIPPLESITLIFDKWMDPNSFSLVDDIASFTGPQNPILTGFCWIDAQTLKIQFKPLLVSGFYQMTVGPQILDLGGNPMDQDGDETGGELPDDQYIAAFDITAPRITGYIPDGKIVAPLDYLQINFDRPMDPNSFLLVDDIPSFTGPQNPILTGFSWIDARTLKIQFEPLLVLGSYQLTVGPQILDLGGNPMDQDGDETGGEVPDDQYIAAFHIIAPRITGHVPDGKTVAPWDYLQINFDGPMDTNSFSLVDDIASFMGPQNPILTGFSWIDAQTLKLQFEPLLVSGSYQMTVGPQILDLSGNPMDQDGDLVTGETPDDQYTAGFTLAYSGTLTKDTSWNAEMGIIIVDGPLTVPIGITLTIEPGTTMKPANSSVVINIQGELNALGTPDQPIVVTSLRDDDVGGDTNGDGGASKPAAGDWQGIVVGTNGKLTLANAIIRYAVNGIGTTAGQKASIVLNGVSIVDSHFYGLSVNQLYCTVQATNCLIARNGYSGVYLVADNFQYAKSLRHCTLTGNGSRGGDNAGIYFGSCNLTLESCVIANNASYGLRLSGDAPQLSVRHCNVYQKTGTAVYGVSSDFIGSYGNISADPLFVDAAGGNYEPGSGSPLIDAGYGSSSALTDIRGLARHDDTGMPNVGSGVNWITDIGAFERQEDTEASDLAISFVSSPSPEVLDPNDIFSVNWTVVNNGKLDYSGGWREDVWLSADDYISSDDILLQSYNRPGPLAAGASSDQSLTMTMPLEVSGLKYILASLAPIGGGLDINTNNNTGCSNGLMAIGLDRIDTETALTAAIQTGQWHYYRYQAESGQTVRFILDSECVTGGVYLYSSYEAIPDAANFEISGDKFNQPDQIADLAFPAIGNYYVAVYAHSPAGGQTNYTLRAQLTDLELTAISPVRIGNAAAATIAIDGINFEPDSRIELVSGETVVAEVPVYYETSQRVYATFDPTVTSVSAGTYSLRVTNAERTEAYTLTNCLAVQEGGGSDFFADIQLPGMARPGLVVSVQLTFGNRGSTDLYSPLLILTGPQDDCEWCLPGDKNWQAGTKIRMMALSTTGPANILRPGQSETITVKFRTPFNYTAPNIAIYLNSLGAREGAGSDDSIDWTLVFGDDDIFQNVAMLYGETWKEYTYTLSKLATIDKIITGSLNYSVATLEEELNNYNLEEQVPEWMELLEEAYGTSFREGEPGALYVRIGSKWEPATIDNLWPEAKTIIIFHGLANSYKEDWIAVMADNLKMKEPGANVMAVDWARYANWLGGTWSAVLFAEAATHIPEVARKVSDNIYGLGLHHVAWKMHFIGHSHGAHVAGLTAKYMLLQIERLTALDASEELAHWRTLKNYGGLGWNKNVAKFTDYYKSSAIMGSERDYGHHNFLLVENAYAWGDTFREYKPTNHGFSINWFTGTIIHNSTYGYYWNENEWGNLKDNITLLSAHEGPWLGLIRGDWNGNGTIETLSLATDKARYTHTWNYPGAWQEVTKLLDSLERAVEMEPHDLSIEILESDSKLKYGGQCILRYSVTNNADNISIDYRKRHASQMGAENRLPVVDSLWLSKNNLLEPPRDYPLNILAHNQILLDPQNPVAGWKQVFLGAEGESNSTQSFEVVLTIPGKDELQSYFEDNTNDEYYILVDAGSTLSQAYRYAEELYPSNNISFPLYITLDDETLSADAGGIYWVTDENGNGVEVVELDGSNSAPSDKIVSYDWNIGVSGVIANYEFSVGEQAITLTVTDLNGNTDTDEALIIVRPKSDIPDGSPEDGDSTITRRPVDPEDKFGPAGYDPPGTLEAEMKRYISDDESMSYHIEFWNHEDAEVPARVVTMRDTLDLAVFDLSTLEFTRIGFLKWDIDLPPGTKAIDRRIDLRPDMDLVIDVTTTVDYETGLVMWRFQCSDPLTGYYPEDPMAGFLPPFNKETGYELGWIEFRVKPVAVMTTGTVIANRAYGEFDDMGDWPKNPAPKEGPWINTVDAGLPTSHVLPLPKISTRHFLVNWEGEDAVEGSGIGLYEIHVSENGTPYSLWLSTSETSAIYEGNLNSTYSFYSIAKDNVGNREEPPSEPDTVTTVELLSPNLDDDMIVNLNDLSLFVEEWLSHDCYINNDWCSYCDFNQDGIVNFKDLSLMAEDWMQLEE